MSGSVQYRDNAILVAIAMLDTTHPGFDASEEVRQALNSLPLAGYLHAYVLSALHTAAGDLDYKWNRSACNERAFRIRKAIRRKSRIAELQAMRQRYVEGVKDEALRVVAGETWDKLEAARELADLLEGEQT